MTTTTDAETVVRHAYDATGGQATGPQRV